MKYVEDVGIVGVCDSVGWVVDSGADTGIDGFDITTFWIHDKFKLNSSG